MRYPKFILQPLIENAVKYSFKEQAEALLYIRVSTTSDQRLILTVADNGTGIPLEMYTTIESRIVDFPF